MSSIKLVSSISYCVKKTRNQIS